MQSTSRTLSALTFMNNKGGVGKTTLACNLAYDLAERQHKNVLVLDLDPQCNATQLLLDEEVWSEILGDPNAYKDRRSLLYVMSDIRRGDSGVRHDIDPIRSSRFGVDVLTGHPSLALLEDTLSSSWSQLLAGDLGGARRTNWLESLLSADNLKYDYVLIDVGPSLGALNRSVLVGSDHVVTPTAADLFSLFALDNIADWISHWGQQFNDATARVVASFGEEAGERGVSTGQGLKASYLGYTIQQYVTKTQSSGKRRGVRSYDFYREQIHGKAKHLSEVLSKSGSRHPSDLGTVPHMFSMVPLAQSKHAPIASLTTADGLRGAQISQQANYKSQLEEIGTRLFDILESTSKSSGGQ